jgi:hypothetical protein
MRQRIRDEIGDRGDEPGPRNPEDRPTIDRGRVTSQRGALEPHAHPDVDRPALERPGVEAAAMETNTQVDAPAKEEGEGEDRGEAGAPQPPSPIDQAASAAEESFAAAASEPQVELPEPVQPIDHVAPVDAEGRYVEPVLGSVDAVSEIGMATQSMRDEGVGLQETAAGERRNAWILEGNVNLVRQGVAQSDLGVTTSQTHAAYRGSVVEQARATLAHSREKTAWVAAEAPQTGAKADEGRSDSEGMNREAGEVVAESEASNPDDEEAAERSREQRGDMNRASGDVGSLDRAFEGSQERSRGLAADAARAGQLNEQAQARIGESHAMLERTGQRLDQMREQTDEAGAQVEELAGAPASVRESADALETEGESIVEHSMAVEERLRTEQETHRANAAAIPAKPAEQRLAEEAAGERDPAIESLPPIIPIVAQPEEIAAPVAGAGAGAARGAQGAAQRGGDGEGAGAPEGGAKTAATEAEASAQDGTVKPPVPAAPPGEGATVTVQREAQAGYEDRYNVDLASPIAGVIPTWLGGSSGAEGPSREDHERAEQERRAAEIQEIQEMAGRPFEELSRWERRKIAGRLMLRHLGTSLSRIRFPGWGTLALGLINPVTPLLGVVSGLSMILTGAANIFNIEAWRRDWLGNLLKIAADIATGLTVILGSITALAAVIAALCTALIIVSFGFLAPALGPVVAFCASVMVTVGGWTIAVGQWALLLQALCFLKNLYEAGVARNATELQRSSDRMSSDVSGAGNVVLQMGMAKLGQIGGRQMQASIVRGGGGGVRWAGGMGNTLPAARSGVRAWLGRGGAAFGAVPRTPGALGALRYGMGIAGVAGRGTLRGAGAVVTAPFRAARAIYRGLRTPAPEGIPTGRAAFGRDFLIGESIPRVPGWSALRAAAEQGRVAAQYEAALLALRTPTGEVNADALQALFARLPTLEAAGPEQLRLLAARTLGLPPESLILRQVGVEAGAVGQQGASGAPVYRIFYTAPGQAEPMLVGVVKTFPQRQAEEFARELSALQRLNQEVLPNQGAARTLGVAQAEGQGVLVMSAARGAPIDSLMTRVGDLLRAQNRLTGQALLQNQRELAEAMETLTAACRRNGEALGTLHSTTRTGAEAAPATLGRHAGEARNITGQLPDLIGTPPRVAIDVSAVQRELERLIAAVERNPGAASVVHGDFHPGNVFYDAATGRITVIDAARVHQSIGVSGGPIASPARDVASFNATIDLFGGGYGIGPTQRQALQAAFMEGYTSTVGANAFTAEALAFYRARFALGQFIEALKTNSARLPGAAELMRSAFGL